MSSDFGKLEWILAGSQFWLESNTTLGLPKVLAAGLSSQ
jgi:hypothetical protein